MPSCLNAEDDDSHSPPQRVHPKVILSQTLIYGCLKGLMGDGGGQSCLLTEQLFLQKTPAHHVTKCFHGDWLLVSEHTTR